jgi:hypothetical protein
VGKLKKKVFTDSSTPLGKIVLLVGQIFVFFSDLTFLFFSFNFCSHFFYYLYKNLHALIG